MAEQSAVLDTPCEELNIKTRFNQYQANHNSGPNAGSQGFAGLIRAAIILVVLMLIVWFWASIQ